MSKNNLNLFKTLTTRITSCMLLLSIIACNANIPEVKKSATNDSTVRKSVAKSIQQQLDILENYENEDGNLLDLLDAKNVTGEEVVSKALGESKGADYLDFCYATNQTCTMGDSSYIMSGAKNLMSTEKYNELKKIIDDNEKNIKGWGTEQAKSIPVDQQEAFYKDLKALIVKSTVMLVAAFVYVAIPATVVWGKISAAAALAIGAGVAASVIMDVYGYFKNGFTPDLLSDTTSVTDFTDWVGKLKESSTAAYAIATAVTSYATTLGMGKVTTAIVLCVFTAFNAITAIADMKKTYTFNA